jgi:tetratricopeptide (TPR) repeat protein
MKTKAIYGMAAVLLLTLAASMAWSQATAGKVQGRVTSQGKPVANAQVTLTNTANGKAYKIKADKDGNFLGVGIAFGDYEEEISDASGEKLFKTKISITGGQGSVKGGEAGGAQDISVDIGSGGAPKMSEAELAKLKSQNEKAMNQNQIIAQLNPALQSKNWAAAEPLLTQLVSMNPTNWEYQQMLGVSQLNLGKSEDAIATFEKGIPLAQAAANSKDPKENPEKAKAAVAAMLNNEGAAYGKLKQPQKAVEAYTKAAAMDPNPGTAYFNLCATQYNAGNTEGALAACDKAIAADPNRADAYYIKGSLMVGDSKLDKEGKLMAPPGTSDALNKYLELAPDGPHATDVKQMLAAIGAKIETTYKEKKKK